MQAADSPDHAHPRWAIYLLLGAVCLVGNYFYASYFGLYEDDYIYTLPAFHWTWADCLAQVRAHLAEWPDGRVVSYVCNDLLTWCSAQGGSLELGYAFGAALLVTNTLLCYRLATGWFPPLGAFAAAAIYALNPADTAKIILMHRAFVLLGSTFLLVALLSYQAKRYWPAYLAAALSLLTYESFFFPFLAAPLLFASRQQFSWRRLFLHGAVCAALLGLVIALRVGMGESRAIESLSSLGPLLDRVWHAALIGPSACLRTLLLRPLDALRYSGPFQCGLMVVSVLITMAVFSTTGPVRAGWRERRGRLATYLPFLGACLLMSGLGYAATVHRAYYPPLVTIGRLSAVHAPTAIPLGLVVGALVTIIAGAGNRPRLVVAVVGLWVGALVSVGLEIQRVDYVGHWQQQKFFWNELLAASGEWEPGVVVLVPFEGREGPPATAGFPPAWVMNYAPLLAQWLVEEPGLADPNSDRPGRVYGYYSKAKSTPTQDGLRLHLPPWKPAATGPVIRDGKFLYYDIVDGHLVRRTDPVEISGRQFRPKAIPPVALRPLPKSDLYYLLFYPAMRWPTIAGARNYPP